MAEESAHRQPVDALPRPVTRPPRVVAAEETHELGQVALVRADGVRRDVALFRQMVEKVADVALPRIVVGGGVAHADARSGAANAVSVTDSRHSVIAANARSAKRSRLMRLSFTRSDRSSSNPKFAFIGWKCAGSASRRYRYRAPIIVVGGGTTGASPGSMRDRLIA